MAKRKYYIGSLGPFYYDDAKAVDDPDGDFAGETNKAFIAEGQVRIDTAPSDGTDALRLDDVGGPAGDVIGPAASTDNAIARFDGAGGKSLQNSLVLIDDSGQIYPLAAIIGDFLGGDHLKIGVDGSVIFKGAAGLVFGSCYGNHIGWTQANAAQNTWYNISDANMADGLLKDVTHDGNGKLTVLQPGIYKVSYSICFENNVANDHVEVGIEVNGSGAAEAPGQCHLENKFASEEEHMGSSALLDLADNSTIELAIRTTDAATPDFTVHAVNITVVQIGGT